MKYSLPVSLTLFLIFFPLIISAQQTQSSQSDFINEILNSIPIEERLKKAPQEIEAEFSQNPLGLPASKNEKLIELFGEGFVIDSLAMDVTNTFNSQFNSEHASSVISWLEKESTKKVMQAIEDSNNLQGARRRVVRMYELEQDPPTDQRENIIQSLIEAISAVESEIESQTILFRSIVSAFSILSDQRNFSESQIDGIVSNYRFQIQNEMRYEIENRYLVTFFNLDDNLLSEYVSFYNSDAGKWLNETINTGIHTAYEKGAERFVESIRNTN